VTATDGLRGRRILVVGLARSGLATVRFLLRQGAVVSATDSREQPAPEETLRALQDAGCRLCLGEHRHSDFLEADLIVISPGVPSDLGPLQVARSAGKTVVGEMELAWRFLPCPVVAVTGSNGKTTTVTALGAMLDAAGIPHWVGGNIGRPLMDFLLEGLGPDRNGRRVIVVEVSSFQLETIQSFRPWIAAWTNLSEDHLDRYPDLEAYAEAKFRIFENQTGQDWAIVPFRDAWLDSRRGRIRSKLLRFGTAEAGAGDLPEIRLEAGRIVWREPGSTRDEGYETGRVRLRGVHNLENLMVALAAARLCGAAPQAIQSVLDSFGGLEHRLEFVAQKDGVAFFNDSKATTVESVLRALESFAEPVLLLAGGKDKGLDFAPLREPLSRHVRRLFLFGEAAERMARELAGAAEIERVRDLDEAVRKAWKAARPGEVVLLSPACSSFDMFRDYEERGNRFKRLVRDLLGETGQGGNGVRP
jgi:UDP-N-acetylmuramoylalanine--D-glutamate ligase